MEKNKKWLKDMLKKYSLSDLYKEDEYGEYYNELRQIYDEFNLKRKRLQKLIKKYTHMINVIQVNNDYFIKGRVKNKEHLIIKILRECKEKGKTIADIHMKNYISYFKDIIGIRVVCINQDDKILFLKKLIDSDLINISNVRFYTCNNAKANVYANEIKNSKGLKYDIKIRDEKIPYDCIHVYALAEEENITFEIQIRTFFEEAWGEVDHTLKYPYSMDDDFLKEQMSILFSVSEVADKIITSVYNHKNRKK